MSHPFRIFAAALALLVLPALPASATPSLNTFGANGSTAVFDCPWNASHTSCDFSQLTSYNGVTSVSATGIGSVAQDIRGTAAVSAEIGTDSWLPVLHAYASSNPDYAGTGPYGGSARADANVWGVQGYRYVGDTPFLLTVTATLDSVFSRPDSDSQGNHSAFFLSLFDTAGYAFGYAPPDVFQTELCPIVYIPGRYGCEAVPAVYDHANRMLHDSGTISATIAYLLQPGQSFYVGAFLDASVCCGATVDSSHTLRLAFNDASLLVNAPVAGALAVPEPSTLPLTALAAAVLLGMRLRRRMRG